MGAVEFREVISCAYLTYHCILLCLSRCSPSPNTANIKGMIIFPTNGTKAGSLFQPGFTSHALSA